MDSTKEYYTVGNDILAIPPKQERERKPLLTRINRTKFLTLAVGTAAAFATNRLSNLNNPKSQPPQEQAKPQSTPPSSSKMEAITTSALATLTHLTDKSPTPEAPKIQSTPTPIEKKPSEEVFKPKINEILKSPPNSDSRVTAEYQYISLVKELKDVPPEEKLKIIDQGFWAIAHPQLRSQLLDERYKLRKACCPNLQPITPEILRLAEEIKKHPEALMVCLEARNQALNYLKALKDKKGDEFWSYFRPDLVYKVEINELPKEKLDQIKHEDLLINFIGMTELVGMETGYIPDRGLLGEIADKIKGIKRFNVDFLFPDFQYPFANIGRVPAIKQLRGSYKEAGDLIIKISELLNKNHQVNFIPESIPGSQAGKDDESGGAMGLQLMPDRILEIYRFMEENFDFKFNPFDLTSSVTGAYIFLARGENVGQDKEGEPLFRYGYITGSHMIKREGSDIDLFRAIRKAALEKWNEHLGQVKIILDKAELFEEKPQLAQTSLNK